MSADFSNNEEIINHEELKMLFPNESQRKIFTKIMTELVEFILRETQIKGRNCK